MKTVIQYFPVFLLSIALALVPTKNTEAQFGGILSAIIKAIDISVQKAQNRVIDLQNVQKQVENFLSQTKLAEISDWVKKQKDLYADYFDELWHIKTVIANFREITDIIKAQKELVSDYKQVMGQLRQDNHLSPVELEYCNNIYIGIIDASVRNVDQILLLLKSYNVQMPDAERLRLLQQAAAAIHRNIADLRSFSRHTIQLSMQRSKDVNDLETIRQLYNVTK